MRLREAEQNLAEVEAEIVETEATLAQLKRSRASWRGQVIELRRIEAAKEGK